MAQTVCAADKEKTINSSVLLIGLSVERFGKEKKTGTAEGGPRSVLSVLSVSRVMRDEEEVPATLCKNGRCDEKRCPDWEDSRTDRRGRKESEKEVQSEGAKWDVVNRKVLNNKHKQR